MPENTSAEAREPEMALNTMFRSDMPVMYTDNVNIDGDGDAVILNFSYTLPGWNEREIGGQVLRLKQAAVFSRVAMTREHFHRFVEMCVEIDREGRN